MLLFLTVKNGLMVMPCFNSERNAVMSGFSNRTNFTTIIVNHLLLKRGKQMRKEDFSKRLKQFHKERHWCQEELFRQGDVSRNTLQDAFSEKANPTLSTIQAICDGLNLSLGEFFSDEKKGQTDYVITELDRELLEVTKDYSKQEMRVLIEYFRYMNEQKAN